ncbi:hypothetical protein PHMEG_000140 [Phytophthora megakarya]|uniref:Transmembrane protein n=1 Tax=Phytophthora megakarya TaxID=4795 RepID=A0A225X6A5_9STRA|nr:hypothetical protein PHMEG_000140 [Phytophthora megakarya]
MKPGGSHEDIESLLPVGSAQSGLQIPGKYLLFFLWMNLGVFPLAVQLRSFVHFVTPHKVSHHLIVPTNAVAQTADVHTLCPGKDLFVADVYWNLESTHYFDVVHGRLCHFVMPQYNVHGIYFLGSEHTIPAPNTQEDCEEGSFILDYYLYHGSFGYFAFYEEGRGSYCTKDKAIYVVMKGLGTYDSNGAALSADHATVGYRCSFWYGIFGSVWIAYRFCILRRSFVFCMRHSERCESDQHFIRPAEALVYVQESMRLSAHNATNYQRLLLMYILVEGIMSELFMLIAVEGFWGKLQYIALAYNLSGMMSMLFEMIESSKCLGEKTRCFVKRLLFNHETVLLGELVCAGALQHYLTALNRTSLRDTNVQAMEASYYVWSLIGHGCIVLGCVLAIVCVRAIVAIIYVRCKLGSLAVLSAPCCVDSIIGVRCKQIMLAGYVYENKMLYYRSRALAAFGFLQLIEESGSEYLVFHKLNWISPKQELSVIGVVSNKRVTPCQERQCDDHVRIFDHNLGGNIGCSRQRRFATNKVSTGPTTLDLLQVS